MTEPVLAIVIIALIMAMWGYFWVTTAVLVHEWWERRRQRKMLK